MEQGDSPQTNLPVPVPAAPQDSGLLLDLGPQARRRIKRLKRGSGRLARQIQAAAIAAQTELGIDPAAEIVPVVILYRSSERLRSVSRGQND